MARKDNANVEHGQAEAEQPETEKSEKSRTNQILKRAQDGDMSVVPELRKLLERLDDDSLFPLGQQPEDALLERMYQKNLLVKEDVRRQCERMRLKLAGNAASPLEKILADRIVLCWLTLNYYETIYAQTMGDLSLASSDFQQKRLDRAHQRYLSAVKSLAQVRRLQLPILQLNVGGQQMNIAENQINVSSSRDIAAQADAAPEDPIPISTTKD